MKRTLTDKFIASLRPAPLGSRVVHWDTKVPSFGVRVTDRKDEQGRAASRTFVVYVRWPGTGAPARREVGDAKRLSLVEARKKARRWLDLVEQGIDPQEQEREKEAAKAKLAEEDKQRGENTFLKVAEDWFRRVVSTQRKKDEVERDVRAVFVQRWEDRPVTEITEAEIEAVIAEKALTAPAHARNLLGYAKRLFKWAARQRRFGMEKSPAANLEAADLVGRKVQGSRVLTDEELRLLWRAIGRLRTERRRDDDNKLSNWFPGDYPFGPLFRLLILTGQRKSEVANARWREFDLAKRLWTIPTERMKSGAAHVVPLTDEMVSILDGLPRFEATKKKRDYDYLFSTTNGESPVNSFGKVKARIDARMLRTLRALARARGESTDAVTLPRWTIHDIRRTMRTGLSALPIPDRVCELMISHSRPELHKIYDLHKYTEEKRRGFELWSAHLRGILQQPDPGSNVVTLQRGRHG